MDKIKKAEERASKGIDITADYATKKHFSDRFYDIKKHKFTDTETNFFNNLEEKQLTILL